MKKPCKTPGCNNFARKKANYCGTCQIRKYRKNNPLRAAYSNLKSNAKRRGKFFDLTFEQFKNFSIKTEYHIKAGIFKESYHIDRIDETKGYSIDNIHILPNHKNIKKYLEFKCRNPDGSIEFTVYNSQSQHSRTPF